MTTDHEPIDPIIPIVHLNGTSREALIEQRCEASHALREALEKLSGCYPNARDYYVGDAGLYRKACTQHEGYENALRRVKNAIEREAEKLAGLP